MNGYVHGYSQRETERLGHQTASLASLLHHDSAFPAGARVLEAGCGTGAATAALLSNSPDIRLTCLDISEHQLDTAKRELASLGYAPEFRKGDLMAPPFEPHSFDHAFACFVLEHLSVPEAALNALMRVIRPGGSVMIIEGDHGSAVFNPETPPLRSVCDALEAAYRRLGCDPCIGRRLHGLLTAAGFEDVRVSPRLVYADAGHPKLREGFIRRVFTPMVEGARAEALDNGFDPSVWSQGIADLLASDAGAFGVVCYTFFKATARRP